MERDKSRNEKYAEKWFREHGFECRLVKQYISKTKYEVSKDGITAIFELPFGVENCKKYMNLYNESFEMKKRMKKI